MAAKGDDSEAATAATLSPQPFLSPLSPTFTSPLSLPEEEPPAAEGVTEGGALPTTFTSPLPTPEPGTLVSGSETRYLPYGEVRTPGEPVAGLTAHTFTGQPPDPATGLMYYRARWYEPRLGRFVGGEQHRSRGADPRRSESCHLDRLGYNNTAIRRGTPYPPHRRLV